MASRMEKGASQQTSLLDVLKKKMRQAREEAEQAKDEADEVKRQLEQERKKREDAEAEVAALNRRIVLVEEDLERTDDRLKVATQKLDEASKAADEAERPKLRLPLLTAVWFFLKRNWTNLRSAAKLRLKKWRRLPSTATNLSGIIGEMYFTG
ncbi:unnamed protein product [Meloidogyne enterolobii]|uniref:Uncharacterized protein n=1 Tax=Meloidogyne enterolobii TaxID=390850 RepID=A0ACB0XK91_MELEN